MRWDSSACENLSACSCGQKYKAAQHYYGDVLEDVLSSLYCTSFLSLLAYPLPIWNYKIRVGITEILPPHIITIWPSQDRLIV